ncbi:LexA family protein [Shewanella sp. 10N.286.48.A6]|uniref:LexA family protein n=1 Tax=Shewanella sp. 10N.286.48.A6 TaxID=1880833 RepID=UPI000C82B523|nr:S24 family peptidase [Shewanella sp. 10N.286.48.A6]PMH96292.1 hypothetical protein BCU55_19395 [Shewanella sp. 10N.286.48.A6]
MQGIGIFDGDILVVDRHLAVRNLDVIVGCYNGEFICKIIDIKNKLLISANPEHKPALITTNESFTLEGVVSRSIRCHRPANII